MSARRARPAAAHRFHLRFPARLGPQLRGYVGVRLPEGSLRTLGTRGQIPVVATVNGVSFRTLVFPTGDGGHYLLVNRSVREAAHAAEGQVVEVTLVRSSAALPPVTTPPDLAAYLRTATSDRAAWESLTPAARRVASRWIDGAKDPSVRAWRIADVLRRARRFHAGEGPFYPTRQGDQALLTRPRRQSLR